MIMKNWTPASPATTFVKWVTNSQACFHKSSFVPAQKTLFHKDGLLMFFYSSSDIAVYYWSWSLTHSHKLKQKLFYPPSGQTLFSVRLLFICLSGIVSFSTATAQWLRERRTCVFKNSLKGWCIGVRGHPRGARICVQDYSFFKKKFYISSRKLAINFAAIHISNHLRLYLFFPQISTFSINEY